ncbi:hypothetical protein Pint_36510 [Pistacia integerrima]|uniref:Uncharacterized protein n=1 Tax=Pistacia integerrima TaxID=434235 RepID=A0ACC0Y2I2_9ROSI|nr:hypothetical protein Pint_36510 [Pistacia integerrima]
MASSVPLPPPPPPPTTFPPPLSLSPPLPKLKTPTIHSRLGYEGLCRDTQFESRSVVDTEIGGCGYSDFDCSKYDLVCKVFDTMERRNVIAWNTMVSWYVKTERYAEAVRQFRMMMMKGIRPSAFSFLNVFPALLSLGDYKNGRFLTVVSSPVEAIEIFIEAMLSDEIDFDEVTF